MTTPNEELIKQLLALGIPDWKTARWLMTEAADALQSQAERIAELELHRDVQIAMFDGCLSARIQVEAERDTLRAQLAEIEKTEPVWKVAIAHDMNDAFMRGLPIGTKLFTRPMPAQDVGEFHVLPELPELPKPSYKLSPDSKRASLYDKYQLTAYGQECRALTNAKGAK